MVADPCEVMEWVIVQEASQLQVQADDEVVAEARAIAETEQQRTRLRDRLMAARGQVIRIDVPGEILRGVVVDVGADIVVIESADSRVVVSIAAAVSIEGLPHALRREAGESHRVITTWSAILRECIYAVRVRFTLADGRNLHAIVESVGADHVDIRQVDETCQTLPFAAIRSAEISR
jgi:pyrroline-5-carboxylate reductase